MKKLSQKNKILVDECRSLVESYAKLQDKAYSDLCKVLDHDCDWLYDYVFNTTSGESNEYIKLVEEQLFE